MKITEENLSNHNNFLRSKSPLEITQWAVKLAETPVVTTNFGPHSASMLNLVTQVKDDVKVIWCDTGYNTSYTYRYANEISKKLNLNLFTYIPHQTSSQRDALFGGIPTVENPQHKIFTEQVKLEPFRRAMKEHQPDVWFTNIRKGQTTFRDSLDILSLSKNGILKVSPFYYWSDEKLEAYLEKNNLPNEIKYFDPTKVLQNRECGLHI
ncbi:MAG: phosphoadenosine phosphosulfate reductase family protein [Saprospiraceae bacterium]